MDFGDVKMEQARSILEIIETQIQKITIKTKKLRISTKGKKCKNTSQFPSIVEIFDDKGDMEECNLFYEDYDEYNTTKRLIKEWRSTKGKKIKVKHEDARRKLQIVPMYFV